MDWYLWRVGEVRPFIPHSCSAQNQGRHACYLHWKESSITATRSFPSNVNSRYWETDLNLNHRVGKVKASLDWTLWLLLVSPKPFLQLPIVRTSSPAPWESQTQNARSIRPRNSKECYFWRGELWCVLPGIPNPGHKLSEGSAENWFLWNCALSLPLSW